MPFIIILIGSFRFLSHSLQINFNTSDAALRMTCDPKQVDGETIFSQRRSSAMPQPIEAIDQEDE